MKVINIFTREVLSEGEEVIRPEFKRNSNLIHLEGGSFSNKQEAAFYISQASNAWTFKTYEDVAHVMEIDFLDAIGNALIFIPDVTKVPHHHLELILSYVEKSINGPIFVTASSKFLKDTHCPLSQLMVENILPTFTSDEKLIHELYKTLFTAS